MRQEISVEALTSEPPEHSERFTRAVLVDTLEAILNGASLPNYLMTVPAPHMGMEAALFIDYTDFPAQVHTLQAHAYVARHLVRRAISEGHLFGVLVESVLRIDPVTPDVIEPHLCVVLEWGGAEAIRYIQRLEAPPGATFDAEQGIIRATAQLRPVGMPVRQLVQAETPADRGVRMFQGDDAAEQAETYAKEVGEGAMIFHAPMAHATVGDIIAADPTLDTDIEDDAEDV